MTPLTRSRIGRLIDFGTSKRTAIADAARIKGAAPKYTSVNRQVIVLVQGEIESEFAAKRKIPPYGRGFSRHRRSINPMGFEWAA